MVRDVDAANDPHDLVRFVDAQAGDYEQAIAEIKNGRKRSHWIWYIFPQIDGLGYSSMSRRVLDQEHRRGQGLPGSPDPRAEAGRDRRGGLERRGAVRVRNPRLARRHEAPVLRDPLRKHHAAGFGVRSAARPVFRGRARWQDAPTDRTHLICGRCPTPLQPLVGSEVSNTARSPTDRAFSFAMTPRRHPESGAWRRRGSFSLGRSNFGSAAFQDADWVICRTTSPVVLSWMTTFAFVKSATWSGATAPASSGQSFGPGPGRPGKRGEDLDLSSSSSCRRLSPPVSAANFDKIVPARGTYRVDSLGGRTFPGGSAYGFAATGESPSIRDSS